MKYKVAIDAISDEVWESHAEKFADYSIYQTPAYQRVRATKDGQELNRVVVLNDASEAVTMCHVRIKKIKPLGFKIGYVQWGPFFRRADGGAECDAAAIKELLNSYLGHRVNVLRIVPNIRDDACGKQVDEMLESAGFSYARTVEPYNTMIVRLTGTESEIRGRFHRSWRRGLNKAENNKIEIREGTSRELWLILERIYESARSRKGFKGLEPDVFIETQELLSDARKVNVIAAYSDGEPISAHSTSHLGDTAVGILAGSSEKGLEVCSSYLVWWHTLLAAKRAGMSSYDLGGIDPVNNPDVYQFKLRMGGEQVRYIGAFDVCSSRAAGIFWRACEKAYNLLKKR